VLHHRRELRKRSTEAESLMWYLLRAHRLEGLKFRRQHSIGPFIVDFACVEKRVIVELDGEYHDQIFHKDQHRQRWLEREGWQVIRFSNDEVLEDVEAVAIAIQRHLSLDSPSPRPSPPK
ncbi:MAG: endonuclease domain-containing protein, partial [Pirellulales bacterium]|nr:endonuclease domain-containing protein [Pirellulales bacterium]